MKVLNETLVHSVGCELNLMGSPDFVVLPTHKRSFILRFCLALTLNFALTLTQTG